MKKLIVTSVAGIALLSFAAGHADSGECVKHSPLPISQEGLSIGEDGDVADAAGTLYVCNNGSTVGPNGDVPVPAKGHAQVGGHIDQGDPAKSEGHVYVDGDQNNRVDGGPGCTDGFVRVDMTAGQEPSFYNGGEGSAEDTNPNQSGKQPAQKKTAQEFAESTAAECS